MISTMLVLFADNTNVFLSHKDAGCLANLLNTELSKLSIWFRVYKLTNWLTFAFRPQKKNRDAFTAAAFSAHLRTVFHGLTGKLISMNMLRSSFITWAYSHE